MKNLPTTTSLAVFLITGGTPEVKNTWQSKSPSSFAWMLDILSVASPDTWYCELRTVAGPIDGLVATQTLL